MFKEFCTQWAVQITKPNGSFRLAMGNSLPVNTFRKRKDALAFANELAFHNKMPRRRMKAVRVLITYELV